MNTLEQIKERQEQINGLLYTLLQDASVVVEKIIGAHPEEDTLPKAEPEPNGLLEEITYSQNTTERYITKLGRYNRLLSERVFNPLVGETSEACYSTGGYKHNIVTTIG